MRKPSAALIPIVAKAVALAGGPTKLCKPLKIARQSIYGWKKVPIEHVNKISDLTGLSRFELRPDVFRKGE